MKAFHHYNVNNKSSNTCTRTTNVCTWDGFEQASLLHACYFFLLFVLGGACSLCPTGSIPMGHTLCPVQQRQSFR